MIETQKDSAKNGDQPPQPPNETILATKQRDPDEAVFAEQAVRGFIRDRLMEWSDQVQSSLDNFEAWALSQTQEDQASLAERGNFDALGDGFLAQLNDVAGGKGTPMMDAIVKETDGAVSMAEHSEHDLPNFINEMRRGLRDACWYARDACQGILSNQWADLLDGAYEGSFDFVGMLYKLGLPTSKFDATDFTGKLQGQAEGYLKAKGPKNEEVAEKPVEGEKAGEMKEEESKLAQLAGEEKKVPMTT